MSDPREIRYIQAVYYYEEGQLARVEWWGVCPMPAGEWKAIRQLTPEELEEFQQVIGQRNYGRPEERP